jgi:hypothetical protein
MRRKWISDRRQNGERGAHVTYNAALHEAEFSVSEPA